MNEERNDILARIVEIDADLEYLNKAKARPESRRVQPSPESEIAQRETEREALVNRMKEDDERPTNP